MKPRKRARAIDVDSFSGPFRAETDRACAVLGAALLDARLHDLFSRRLRWFGDELLTHSGPLGSFSSRIRLARALAWIDEDVHFDLDQIRTIRNLFAHEPDHQLSFKDQATADRCRTLRVAATLIEANEAAAANPTGNLSSAAILAMGSVFRAPRQRFEITVEMLAQHLDELQGEVGDYAGPVLRDELWKLGSMSSVKVSAVGVVGKSDPSSSDS